MNKFFDYVIRGAELSFESAEYISEQNGLVSGSRFVDYKLDYKAYNLFERVKIRLFSNGKIHCAFNGIKNYNDVQVILWAEELHKLLGKDSNGCSIILDIDNNNFKNTNYCWYFDSNHVVMEDGETNDGVYYGVSLTIGDERQKLGFLNFHKMSKHNYIFEEKIEIVKNVI